MSTLARVEKWSKILEWMTAASLMMVPLAVAATLYTNQITPDLLEQRLENFSVSPFATQRQMYLAIALSLIPMVILLFTLNTMRQLFRSYREGQVLTDRCAALIHRIGQGFLALSLVPFALHPVLSVILSMANPSGERSISVAVNNDTILFAVAGGFIMVIGWAMREASDLASENRAFV
jgi:hypothetical protein